MTTLRRYTTEAGARALVTDTAHGRTTLTDVPLGDDGRVYLVECDVDDASELRAIAAEYAARSEQLGRPAILLDVTETTR
jgi:NAD(P)-dependent dehydrogenase (short-subunit alcohol dehydrogenase family)